MESTSTRQHGFTLSALVVTVIALGSITVAALPRLPSNERSARIESVDAMEAMLRRTVDSVHTVCLVDPRCNVGYASQFIQISGKYERVNHGWLDASHAMHHGEIDAWVHFNKFSASMPDAAHVRFEAEGAADPAQCAVTYFDAHQRGPRAGAVISKAVDGC